MPTTIKFREAPDPNRSMAHRALQLRVLGPPQLWWGGVDLARRLPDKQQALLYVIAVEDRPMCRTALTRLFWGRWPDEAARANLRVALSQLRRSLPGVLDIDARRVGFAADGPVVVSDFGMLCDAQPPGSSLECRLEAVRAWRGAFLADFDLPDCDEFEHWCAARRHRAEGLMLCLLRELMHASLAEGRLDEAAHHARRLLLVDEADEAAHMTLMHLLAVQGERTAALRQYAECAAALAEQFGARPSARCYALYVRIHADTLPSRADLHAQMVEAISSGLQDGHPRPGDAPRMH